jgi:hypothetical protein
LGLYADIAQKPNFEARRGQSRQCWNRLEAPPQRMSAAEH